jgi:hypothetical protein
MGHAYQQHQGQYLNEINRDRTNWSQVWIDPGSTTFQGVESMPNNMSDIHMEALYPRIPSYVLHQTLQQGRT